MHSIVDYDMVAEKVINVIKSGNNAWVVHTMDGKLDALSVGDAGMYSSGQIINETFSADSFAGLCETFRVDDYTDLSRETMHDHIAYTVSSRIKSSHKPSDCKSCKSAGKFLEWDGVDV